ncbi:hypothetical protein PGTUg99_022664 [Puccinia graminis f. sp. tritici]|uniref:Uncharacterized protein n=1 Tax=Puccinia graminis f. sp. tritici TaxID=56615 RepID=A0A5B0MCY5_PUCGR|nr:hypothetical protein PGTUg99_022664 [Puccinia graminis f. sp. tritici]
MSAVYEHHLLIFFENFTGENMISRYSQAREKLLEEDPEKADLSWQPGLRQDLIWVKSEANGRQILPPRVSDKLERAAFR